MGTKKIKVIKKIERKTFLKGNFVGKYHGDFVDGKSFLNTAKYYDIHIYEGEIHYVQIISEEAYESIASEIHFLQDQFENVISVTEEKVTDFDAFKFKINQPKVKSITIKDVNKEDNQTFGTFTCVVYGYLIDTTDKEEIIEVEVCDYCNHTLEKCNCPQLISEDYIDYVEEQEDSSTKKREIFSTYNTTGYSEIFGWIIMIGFGALFLAAIGLPGIILIAFLAALYFILTYFSTFTSVIINILGWVFRLLVNFVVFMFFISLITGIYSSVTNSSSERTIKPKQKVSSAEEKAQKIQLQDSTFLISHKRIWRDYDNHLYKGNLSVLESDYKLSRAHRNQIDFKLYNDYQWSLLYNSLIENDRNKLENIYVTFDSIGKANGLNRKQFAEMVVSCIQDIPYALVMQHDCNKDSYEEDFIKHQLDKCPQCCIRDIKYGIQAPVEFTANLKGDCDTRTVMLFTILSKFGFDVAVLGSLSYQHSIIAINLPYSGTYKVIKGRKYYVWETTASGFEPGILDPKSSNMNLWNVHLLTNNN
ncbi:hypothetical protein [Algibacter sp. 2305UL17-15]|uniref:hypothetical protein n=1 Tax=Algibacter sp. 2305UL17-15 TaxID=3231268 RepID=UPI0034580287